MRYRPFGRSGVSTAVLTLNLTDEVAGKGGAGVRELVFAALEAGINSYQISGCDPAIPAALGDALRVVDRRLVFVSRQLGFSLGRTGKVRDFSPESLTGAVDHGLMTSGLGHFDLVVLAEPAADELQRDSLEALKTMSASGRIGLLGVAGDNDAMDAYISSNAFDVLAVPYHLRSGWKERNRLKAAVERDMGILAFNWFPEELSTAKAVEALSPKKGGLFRGREASPLEGMGTYQFLHRTPNWTAEEICLSYVLTEPALASVLIECADVEHLTALAAVPERDMPPGLAAQVEMARFAPMPEREAS